MSRPFHLRLRATLGGLGGGPARLWMAAALACRRHHADARQRSLVGRRLDFKHRAQTPRRPTSRRAGPARHFAVVPSAIGARRHRREVLSALFARTGPRDSVPALYHARQRRRAASAGADRALLRLTLLGQSGAPYPLHHTQARRRIAAADTARWRSHLAQSRSAHRTPDRPVAVAADLCSAQHRAAARVIERDRPDDADAAVLSAWGWQLRAVHGDEQPPFRFARTPAPL